MSGADVLRGLHHGPAPLVLPNAWDAASARLVEAAGFPAVATGSAGVAASLGYEDNERAPVEEMLTAAGRICRAVSVPVTVDAEAGYGLPPDELAARLAAAGAAGCNVEDTDHAAGGLVDAERQAERLAGLGAGLVVNARVDVFIREWGDPADRLAEAVRRGRLYLEAGAECVYPIWVVDEETIARLVDQLAAPVNVLYRPGAPSLRRLAELGVARISLGPGLHRATETATRAILERMAAGGDPY
ncbi:MAG TPA: isocitrate lyase/phosphoenolpyruvate mutase family protein [Gaiellaceae bacterium]|nr:isocitrate lyase/phosphoenolpyruvate mutase family protein [Gaiellaceae bacterium]